ncbi:MAG TPA: glutamyl-tRNA reductase [Tepidisphaeraceae bacterium]|nr:glutamyl-tRNA reductase [Tepidisphaeraceae bacterium]
MRRLLLLGLNHTTAPLEVRERLAFSPDQHRRAIELFREKHPACEIVVLSTCNRVEVYLAREVHGRPRIEDVAEFLSEFHQIPMDQFKSHLYERAEKTAVQHLFSVAASLDSMVLGESQIIGQVRQAYELSKEMGAAGTVLNPLFQRALAVGKEVHSATPLGEGRLSVAGIAVQYARQIFERFEDKSVLCVGAGKMAGLALRGFAALRPRQLVVCNRDVDKAARVADEFGGIGASLEALDEQLVAADIVITSTGATRPIIMAEQFQALLKRRRYRPIFIIDIAVPRDVDPMVATLDNVYLYNLDDLQKAMAETRVQRGQAVEQAQGIVDKGVEEFSVWLRQRAMGPMIDQLYKRLHELAADEVARTIPKMPSLDEAQKSQLQELARRIVNKVLHDPVTALRQNDPAHGGAGQYLHAIERMFRLNELPSETGDENGREQSPQ